MEYIRTHKTRTTAQLRESRVRRFVRNTRAWRPNLIYDLRKSLRDMHSSSFFFYAIAKANGKTGNSSCNSAYWREIITRNKLLLEMIVFEIYPSSRSFITRYKLVFLKIKKNFRKEMLKVIFATKNVAIHFLSHTCEHLHLVPHGIVPADITVLAFKHLHVLTHTHIYR